MHSIRGACRLAQALGASLLAPALAFALVITCGSALAEWTAVGSGDYIHVPYADRATIRRNGTMVRMSGMYDFRKQDFTPEGKGLYSTVVLREYDCSTRQVRLLSAIDFSGPMGAGTAVSTSDTPRRWEAVVAGGIDELYWNAACSAK
jgi:hypothetical protein